MTFPSQLTLGSVVKLNSGYEMPILGFGTWSSANAEEACTQAIQTGYRHFDSARVYGTEIAVAQAVKKCELDRESIFLTTKIRGTEHGAEECRKALADSVTAPKPKYWDLVLLHDPLSKPAARHEAFEALVEAQKDGKVKSIGVSNFGVRHLEKLAGVGPIPAVNQLELHPWCQQRSIVNYCRLKGIIVQAYCPLARGKYMKDETLIGISKKVSKTPAQVLLRWSLQSGFVPLPKSDNPQRIKENADIFDFELDEQDMISLNSLNQVNDEVKDRPVSWTAQFEGVE